MNQQLNLNEQPPVYENVLAGIVGAFLFSLAGGVLWYVLYMIGILAAVSGLVGAICAIKGYSLFAKKESVKGIVISVILSLVVMVIAWYFCLAHDIYAVHQEWYAAGEIDFTYTFFESVRVAPYFLQDAEIRGAYLKDLIMGLAFCVIGGGSYVVNKIKNAKAATSAPAPAPAEAEAQEDDFAYAQNDTTNNESND